MDGSGTLFSEFISALPPGVQPLVITYPPNKPMGYTDLEALTRERLPSRPFILLGESFSGVIAVALAAGAPSTLRGVVLVGAFVRSPIPALRGFRSVLGCLPIWRIPIRIAATVLLGRSSSASARNRLAAAITAVAPATWRARLSAVLSVDAVEKLSRVRVPVLYLRGRSDRVVPRSAWYLIKSGLPSARIVELDGPHFLLQAKPVECAAQVTAFAREAGFAL
jgi:pimeloyl-[acyl-carrier protein] methyl ester esterase